MNFITCAFLLNYMFGELHYNSYQNIYKKNIFFKLYVLGTMLPIEHFTHLAEHTWFKRSLMRQKNNVLKRKLVIVCVQSGVHTVQIWLLSLLILFQLCKIRLFFSVFRSHMLHGSKQFNNSRIRGVIFQSIVQVKWMIH